MTVHYCFDSKRIYVLTAKMVSLMTEDGEGKSRQKRGSCEGLVIPMLLWAKKLFDMMQIFTQFCWLS